MNRLQCALCIDPYQPPSGVQSPYEPQQQVLLETRETPGKQRSFETSGNLGKVVLSGYGTIINGCSCHFEWVQYALFLHFVQWFTVLCSDQLFWDFVKLCTLYCRVKFRKLQCSYFVQFIGWSSFVLWYLWDICVFSKSWISLVCGDLSASRRYGLRLKNNEFKICDRFCKHHHIFSGQGLIQVSTWIALIICTLVSHVCEHLLF